MDALLKCFRSQLPTDTLPLVESYLKRLQDDEYGSILQCDVAESLFGHRQDNSESDFDGSEDWKANLSKRIGVLLSDQERPELQAILFCIGYTALLAFLQSNVTGPPLPFSTSHTVLPRQVSAEKTKTQQLRRHLIESLGVDGVAAYKLTPNVELLCLADAVMSAPAILDTVPVARWAKLRTTFLRQRVLSEPSSTLQTVIYEDLAILHGLMLGTNETSVHDDQAKCEFLIERSAIHTHHGYDKLAREDLEAATHLNRFEFALTGLLGKRTKFQQKDVSQLVVIAQSNGSNEDAKAQVNSGKPTVQVPSRASAVDGADSELNETQPEDITKCALTLRSKDTPSNAPQNLSLNDDTLLESIDFTQDQQQAFAGIKDSASIPPSLGGLDPSNQPKLDPLDSTVLLSLASSITNTSPEDGLTREETLPYATRVLEGGSSNWQVYTQALLVRSRIEGYKSRTVERGLLQLQALVDQVIADTANTSQQEESASSEVEAKATNFLPRPKDASESAPASERLRYIFQLASPTRWDLEAELADRWVQLGGLRSALDIYERLEMWAEAALCWAATEREDKAKNIVRRQLFHASNGKPDNETGDDEIWDGPARDPPPLDAPRLYCILGDLDQDVAMWEKAWEVSKERYARAQRSLGRYWLVNKDLLKSAAAFSKSLKVNRLNHGSWFALGCVLLELFQFERAAEAFSRCVQLDDTDAEAWSNFAAALLKLDPDADESTHTGFSHKLDDEEEDVMAVPTAKRSPQKNRQDALKALKRAATLKHDNFRIWQNIIVVAASVSPPDYTSLLTAQRQTCLYNTLSPHTILTMQPSLVSRACLSSS
ncbi:hypothetical protein K431DRAFT_283489 [Polychaeton citri CBS 116435]|uniref:TPR-like protein n=1 Tax=Polychaeton citri CBS 116435 TaxID=1314669 RepID=A0A9P4URN8_9PEZI|nr:hypothetical protein K431DRAFT_283489 [Polychaeton citri CBS 116435]